MNNPIYIIQVDSRAPGKEEKTGYLYIDRDAGCPAYDDSFFRAELFTDRARADRIFAGLLDDRPTTYGSGDFSQHAINIDLRRAVGGRVDLDGLYHFKVTLFEICGKGLLDFVAVPRRDAVFTVEQFHNKPDTRPIYRFIYNGPTANG